MSAPRGPDRGSAHAHGHARAADRGRLRRVLLLTGVVAVAELVGAWLSSSLALLADAGHMLTDATGIGLALSASLLAARPVSARRTWGLHRAEIIAAALNAFVLLGVCGVTAWLGVRRLLEPAHVDGAEMLAFAVVGLVANLLALRVLHGSDGHSLNMRGAWLEVVADTAGSVGAIVAGVLVVTAGWHRADSIASLVIAALVLPRAGSLLREAGSVLLEAAPPDLDIAEVRDHLCAVAGVVDVHDLHAWTITSGMPALSAHVTVTEVALRSRGVGPILDDLTGCVAGCFGIDHATFQVEPEAHRDHEHDTAHP